MATNISPGLFHLDLPFNKPELTKDAFKMKLLDIEADLEARKGRPEELAILNLIGVFNCRLERYKDAEEKFRDVLSKDEHNLNALANMQYVLDKLYRTVDGRRYKSKLDMFLSKSTEEAVGVRMKARCLAEQAYAYACDMHTDHDSVGRERFVESNDLFQRALDLGGDLVEIAEKDIWKFCIAKNAHKIFDRLSYSEHQAQATDYMDKAIENFYEITQKDPGDAKYQGESWRHLADILRKVQERKYCSSDHLPEYLEKYIEDPELCMKKALECDPDNPRILARYGNFLYHHKRYKTEEALRLLNKSIALDKGDYNFYAFSTRGTVRLKFYNWKMRKATADRERHSKPERSVLELAKIDMERAIDIRHASWDLQNIAEVCHLLAQCDPDEPKESKRQYLEKEFEYLKRAADCENGNRLMSVKRLLGRCLFDLGHYRESIKSYDEALNLQPAISQYTGYFYEQFRSYLCLLQSDPKDDSPLKEMAQSLRQAVAKYGTSALIKHGFGKLRAEYKHELQVFADFCETIQNSDSLLYVLTSNEPPGPFAPPRRPGGLLKESWENPEKEDHGVGEPDKGNSKTVDIDSVSPVASEQAPSLIDASKDVAPSPDSGLEAPNQNPDEQASQATESLVASNQTPDKPADGAAVSLVEGISSMAITDSPPEKDSDRTLKDFDFFVVHTASDAEWVHEELLPKLGMRKLKGCTTQEYALAGSFVLTNELHLMESSACILFVLTSGFETECEFLMHHALKLKKAGHVIFPLRRGKSAVPRELQDILFCFDATRERVNWEKLAQDIKRQIDAAKELPVHD